MPNAHRKRQILPLLPEPGACPECGAARVDGLDCWGMLGALLAWEGSDPALLAEHFQTVACYNLQHPATFTDEALAQLRLALTDYRDRGVSPQELRRRAAAAYAGSTRVYRAVHERHPVRRTWTRTIAYLYAQGEAEGAAERVRRWGETVCTENTLP